MNNNGDNYCLLIRGKPCSGKTTITNLLRSNLSRCELVDPDNVSQRSKEFLHFSPRMTKNPKENVKMYCFLYNQAEKYLVNGSNVVWSQPWSRQAEVDLTIRNFGYYLTNLRESVWINPVENITKLLPFKLLVLEIGIGNSTAIKRWKKKNPKYTEEELNRLTKTVNYFQSLRLHSPYLIINGKEAPEKNLEQTIKFISSNS